MTRRKLLRVVEIAEILGVSNQRADQLRRGPDFPAPVDRWARGDLWAAADIRRWARTFDGGATRWGPRCCTFLAGREKAQAGNPPRRCGPSLDAAYVL
jgi:predicted DNA-binding transcriptional regulator AlpA